MRVRITPSDISGQLAANPSKSHAQRLIAIAALARGTTTIMAPGTSDDVNHAIGVARAMGAGIEASPGLLRISGNGNIQSHDWECGESGLGLRLFAGIAALYDNPVQLIASGSLQTRPVGFMSKTFIQLGVAFESNDGMPPVRIRGKYQHALATVDGAVGSQFLTGLLIALPLADQDTVLEVSGLKSRPYIDLTLGTMQDFGIEVIHEDYRTFRIEGRRQYTPVSVGTQGDWSGMAFILVCAAIAGNITVTGLPAPEDQADGKIVDVLIACGADVKINKEIISINQNRLSAFEVDCTHCPDLFPPLVALAVHCAGTSVIHGVHRLRTKESDRSQALIREFGKLGVEIALREDAMYVPGGPISGGVTESHNDHRIAMAMATAALKAQAPVIIAGAECISKSYPGFIQDLQSAGVDAFVESA